MRETDGGPLPAAQLLKYRDYTQNLFLEAGRRTMSVIALIATVIV